MTRHIKISWLIAGIFFLLLFATLTLHNFFTALTGKEDKIFYFFFIVLFFIFPFSLFYAVLAFIISKIKQTRAKEKTKTSIL